MVWKQQQTQQHSTLTIARFGSLWCFEKEWGTMWESLSVYDPESLFGIHIKFSISATGPRWWVRRELLWQRSLNGRKFPLCEIPVQIVPCFTQLASSRPICQFGHKEEEKGLKSFLFEVKTKRKAKRKLNLEIKKNRKGSESCFQCTLYADSNTNVIITIHFYSQNFNNVAYRFCIMLFVFLVCTFWTLGTQIVAILV